MSEKQTKAEHRGIPSTEAFRRYISSGWAPSPEPLPERAEVADHAARRRARLSEFFPGERLVIPAGGLKVRSNDCDYMFRPHSAFAHLTGLGADREPDAVLVLEPAEDGGHESILYFRPSAGRDSEEFFTDSRYGEYWVGSRPTLASTQAELGLECRDLSAFENEVGKDVGSVQVRVVRDADDQVAAQIDTVRATALTEGGSVEEAAQVAQESDLELARVLSTMRLVKDPWEVDQMRQACAATARAFEAVVAEFPEAIRRGRGERWIEGTFNRTARHEGNGVGYESICAAADHANTLHWIRNTGDIREGDLLLLDAGVEMDSLFTADITRTMPVSGTFTPAQRRVYEAVHAAQAAGFAAIRPGHRFKDVHAAAIRVIAEHLHRWGLLPEGASVEDSLDLEHGQWHRRWMVHGTSHHLGLDVHDCARALREDYMDAELRPGMILTVEPGLYFKEDDLLVPEELRGIGVRIEDDVLVTEDGCEILSPHLPSQIDELESWLAKLLP
ncbi:Xaa-Pro aminopeptidase [Austwickia chelonae]|uniref:aminopeptidase P family protein n=1 Tax=Austwickia chelonae TaxID=100225 RepID=UPI00058D3F7C|nr:aminopeptidase P family protein [Austwickia chelonae]SEV99935.1 Xaa-Pro aminopeptidase [Austwickia chelonae]